MNCQIEDDQYFKVAFNKMNVMRENGLYCDVILIAKDMEIHAHKIVLASCSEFFKTFFDLKEERLYLQEIEGKILLALINYLYTNRIDIEINMNNIQNLLTGINILQLKSLKKECCKYLENNVNVNTSLQILSIAQDENYLDLLNKVEDFIDKNFIEIMNTQDFLNLSIDKLTRLISKETLEVQSEEKIYEGVISWIKSDLTRTKYLSVLMKHIRLTLIHRDYLTKIINEPLVKNDLECKDLIINFLLKEKIPKMITLKERKRGEYSRVLLIMGGSSEQASETFEFYDLKTNSRSQIYAMPSKTYRCNLAVVYRKIYVVERDDIKEYDLVNNRWNNSIRLSSLNTCYGTGILNDCIYTSEGKFNVSKQKWSSIAAMSSEVHWPSVGVFNGFLYAVGSGIFPPSKSVECYNPKLNVWKRCSDLITSRSDAAIGILHNKMYVIGGINENGYLKCVECYSAEINKFTQLASLNFPRSRSTAVEFNDKLYVIGGQNKNGKLDTIEVYCPKSNKWEVLPTTMNVGRSEHGAVIVDKMVEF